MSTLDSLKADVTYRIDRMKTYSDYLDRSDLVAWLTEVSVALEEIEETSEHDHDECYSIESLQELAGDEMLDLQRENRRLSEELAEMRATKPKRRLAKPRRAALEANRTLLESQNRLVTDAYIEAESQSDRELRFAKHKATMMRWRQRLDEVAS